MKIEIAEPGRMTQTGSSLLKLIQNNDMPVLDLLVRESIQHSLDARKSDSKYVEVNYLTGQFDNYYLSGALEGITEPLRRKYPEANYEFIAVRDSNTVGLTGEMDYKKIKNNEYGNLLKLIYEICKPQEAEGAGGSWGLGKTVYFRIGIGIVIYYSRIKTGMNKYESRLAASYVENENAEDALIPVYKDQAKRGIAWWGKSVGENITQPVTDEKYIKKFLRIFDIRPYDRDETGTAIIIPYIDSEKLLSNNRIEYLNGKGKEIIPYWCHSIEDYIKISAQRWYAPRLNNNKYTHGAFLRMKINDAGIGYDDMEPVFKVIQALYNRASYAKEDDFLTGTEAVTKVDVIRVLKYLNDSTVGVVAYTKVPRTLLYMDAPHNKPEPFMFMNCEIRQEDINRPTVCFVRKPGMIVAYENDGPWASNIASTAKDEYIFGIFVLNSWNKLKGAPREGTLEEYVRRSEMADHTSWSDWSEGTYNPRIIVKIQNGVNKLISKEFSPMDTVTKPKANSGLGKLFGDMLLPPDGFGKKPSPGHKPDSDKPGARRGILFHVEENKIKYFPHSMMVPFILETGAKRKISYVSLRMQIDSESKRIDINEWENKMALQTPFFIRDFRIEPSMIDGKKKSESVEFQNTSEELTAEGITFRKILSDDKTCYGLQIISDEQHSIKARIIASIEINRKDVKPVFVYEKGELNG